MGLLDQMFILKFVYIESFEQIYYDNAKRKVFWEISIDTLLTEKHHKI